MDGNTFVKISIYNFLQFFPRPSSSLPTCPFRAFHKEVHEKERYGGRRRKGGGLQKLIELPMFINVT